MALSYDEMQQLFEQIGFKGFSILFLRRWKTMQKRI